MKAYPVAYPVKGYRIDIKMEMAELSGPRSLVMWVVIEHIRLLDTVATAGLQPDQ